jgi:hypothetical protein
MYDSGWFLRSFSSQDPPLYHHHKFTSHGHGLDPLLPQLLDRRVSNLFLNSRLSKLFGDGKLKPNPDRTLSTIPVPQPDRGHLMHVMRRRYRDGWQVRLKNPSHEFLSNALGAWGLGDSVRCSKCIWTFMKSLSNFLSFATLMPVLWEPLSSSSVWEFFNALSNYERGKPVC